LKNFINPFSGVVIPCREDKKMRPVSNLSLTVRRFSDLGAEIVIRDYKKLKRLQTTLCRGHANRFDNCFNPLRWHRN
jgi:hypothetical protein